MKSSSRSRKRKNSCGAHYRDDFTSQSDFAASRYTVVYDDGGKIAVVDKPVEFTLVKPGESLIGEAAAAQ